VSHIGLASDYGTSIPDCKGPGPVEPVLRARLNSKFLKPDLIRFRRQVSYVARVDLSCLLRVKLF
jgi:hypothetical protein